MDMHYMFRTIISIVFGVLSALLVNAVFDMAHFPLAYIGGSIAGMIAFLFAFFSSFNPFAIDYEGVSEQSNSKDETQKADQ